jgi:hypothetical protein
MQYYDNDDEYDLAWQEDEDEEEYFYEGYYDEFQDDEDDYNPCSRGQKVEPRMGVWRPMHDDDDEDED